MRMNTAASSLHSVYISADTKNASLKNCVIQGGELKARKGIAAVSGQEIFFNDGRAAEDMSFVQSDCYVYIGGNYGRIICIASDNLMGNIEYSFRVVFEDGQVQDIGSVVFTPSGSGYIGYPDTFTVFTGSATVGCGIYLIVRQVYTEGDDFIRVMELSENMTEWLLLTESEIYTPTLLANGRGNKYYMAMPNGEKADFPKQTYPQPKNLINRRFISYYTSDSASSQFKLPLQNLDNDLVRCTFSYFGEDFVFDIYADNIASETVNILGVDVFAVCYRDTGEIQFKTAENHSYSPEYAGVLNNIKVIAYKTDYARRRKAASMTVCRKLAGTAGKYGEDVNVFYGSRLYPADIIVSSPISPLYFPESSVATVGESSRSVTNVYIKNRRLLVFKQDRLYYSDTSGWRYEVLKIDENGVSGNSGAYIAEIEAGAELPCKILPKTVAENGDDFFAASSDGNIYRLQISGASSKCEILGNIKICAAKCFATIYNGAYLLISGNRAVCVFKDNDEYGISIWTLPENAIGGLGNANSGVLFMCFNENEIYYIYPAVSVGVKDVIAFADNDIKGEAEHNVSVRYKKEIDISKSKSFRIYSIVVNGHGLTEIELFEGDKKILSKRIELNRKRACINVGLTATAPLFAEISASDDVSLNGVTVEYRLATKIKTGGIK